jgi:tetratricopeptide (TPR) repeat protein
MKKIFAFICIISLAFGQLGFAQTAQVAPFAEGKVFGLFELKGAIESADPARLREVAFSSVPPDASNRTKDLYYGALAYAAINISNLSKAEEIVRQWRASNTGSHTPTSTLFTMLWRATATKMEEAVILGHQLIATRTTNATEKIQSRANLAELYLSLGEYAKAEELLKESEALLIDLLQMGVRGEMAMWAPNTRGQYFKVRCVQQIGQFQFKKAEESCLQSVGLFADALNYKRMGKEGPAKRRGAFAT